MLNKQTNHAISHLIFNLIWVKVKDMSTTVFQESKEINFKWNREITNVVIDPPFSRTILKSS
jgi:hypothetical protein